ncbi:hypothetical protein GC176_23035 [bacterium]|nr:hypothetical protein [bacterium]
MKLRLPATTACLTALAAGSLAGCQSPFLPSAANNAELTSIDRRVLAQYEAQQSSESQSRNSRHQAVSVREPRWGVEGEGADGVARVATGKPAPHRATPSGASIALMSYSPTAYNAPPGEIAHPGAIAARRSADPTVQAVSFSQAEPRLSVDENGQRILEPDSSWMTGTDAQRYPDEYLFDGGDRELPVHEGALTRYGLDTQDTIVEYSDHTGKKHLKESNQVAIYAPRFSAVRAVTTPGGEFNIERLAGMQDRTHNSGVRTKIGPQRYDRTDRLKGLRVRSRASGIETQDWQSGLASTVRLSAHEKLINAFMDFSFAMPGETSQANEARLQVAIDAASQWTRHENPVVIAKLDSLHQVEARFKAAEMVGVEDEAPKPGDLRIVKLADRSSAKPGDVVTFVIRYDNVGDRELRDVTIVDNLTPRLEFLEDSATSDLPGEVFMEDNGEGSLVLTFRLDNPLPGHKVKDAAKNRGKDIRTGGVITFQCRVR